MHIVANWKQFLTPDQEIELTKQLIAKHPLLANHTLTILPSFLSLREVGQLLHHTNIGLSLGAQDIASNTFPAQTGNIRADFLAVDTILIGHSEREKINHENIHDLSNKLKVALDLNKKVILCFGEKEKIASDDDLLSSLKTILQNYSSIIGHKKELITLAYEPQWSIGSTKTASRAKVIKVLALAQAFGFPNMLYGGSVDHTTVSQLYFQELSGFLVGRASTKYTSLQQLVSALDSCV